MEQKGIEQDLFSYADGFDIDFPSINFYKCTLKRNIAGYKQGDTFSSILIDLNTSTLELYIDEDSRPCKVVPFSIKVEE